MQVWVDRNSTKGVTAGSYVDLFVTESELGLPDRANTVASVRLYDSAIPATPTLQSPTIFTLPEPLAISGSKQYAIILATPSSGYYAWGCELGQYDTTHSRWISAKPTTGTMLSSSNSETWLPQLQDDLTFVVEAAQFQSSSTVTYPTVTVTNCTDLMLLATVEAPSGTSVSFTVSLTVGNTTVSHAISPNAPIIIPLYTGPVILTATLATTNPWLTPSIDPQVSLAYATVTSPSTYVTRDSGRRQRKRVRAHGSPRDSRIRPRTRRSPAALSREHLRLGRPRQVAPHRPTPVRSRPRRSGRAGAARLRRTDRRLAASRTSPCHPKCGSSPHPYIGQDPHPDRGSSGAVRHPRGSMRR